MIDCSSTTPPSRRPKLPSSDGAARGPRVEHRASVSASAAGAPALHAALAAFWSACDAQGAPAGPWRDAFATALGEIVANSSKHACQSAPEAEISLLLTCDQHTVAAVVEDRCLPFTRGLDLPMPIADAKLDVAEEGRGLAIARALLDELAYQRTPDGTNVWTLNLSVPAATA